MSAVFPEYERQLVALARQRSVGASSERRRRSWLSARVVMPVLSVLASLAVLLGAVVSLHSSGSSAGNSTQASLKSLMTQYAVLRRPQTAADRALAGRAPTLGGTSRFGAGGGPSRGHLTTYYRVRISGLSHYVAIPTMTRVVVADRIRVALFVERYVRVTAPPKVTITGNDRNGAERNLRSFLRIQRRFESPTHPDILVVKVPGGRARPLSSVTGYSERALRNNPDATGAGQVVNASFQGRTGRSWRSSLTGLRRSPGTGHASGTGCCSNTCRQRRERPRWQAMLRSRRRQPGLAEATRSAPTP